MLQLHLSKNSSSQLCVTIQVFLSNFLLLVSKKKVTRYLLHVKYSLIHSNMETVKRLVVFRSLGLGSNEQAEHGGFLGHWSYLVWHYNDRFMSLYISSNWNVQHQEQTFSSVQFSHSVVSDPMNRSTPGLPVHHQFREFTQTHVHQVSDAIQPSHLLSYPSPPARIRLFPLNQLFAWGGQCTGVSASASVLPMNTQDWSPLGWTGWISLQSKGLARVFSSTTVQKHQFIGTQLSSQSNSHIHTWPLEKP